MRSGPKKGAFENSTTGYGKHRYNSNPACKHNNANKASTTKSEEKDKKPEEKKEKKVSKIEGNDEDLNSGFGDYLRSGEGVEMMKLFIFANTIMVILTMGWPHFREQYYWFLQWWNSYSLEQ